MVLVKRKATSARPGPAKKAKSIATSSAGPGPATVAKGKSKTASTGMGLATASQGRGKNTPASKTDDPRIGFTVFDKNTAREEAVTLDELEATEPLDSVSDAMHLLLKRLQAIGLGDVERDGGARIRIGTMCSGTDAPVFALRQLEEAAVGQGAIKLIDVEHKFSVEIEAFKQSFIMRNVPPTGEIFRDVTEMHEDEA